ncbi:MAG: SBBP repeat-containing protein [Bacteroidia bacterium]|nr:SBBP repeat-containing protein [Bacteroidia bacterium]
MHNYNEYAAQISIDQNGNMYLAGQFEAVLDFDPGPATYSLLSMGASDFYVAKYDPSGNFQWVKTYGNIFQDIAHSITTDQQGNIYVTGEFDGVVDFNPPFGYTVQSNGPGNGFLLKLDAGGNFQWVRTFKSNQKNIGMKVRTSPDGKVWVVGNLSGITLFDGASPSQTITTSGNYDAFFVAYTPSGNYITSGCVGGSDNDYGKSLAFDSNGNLYFLVEFYSSFCDADPGAGTSMFTNYGGSSNILCIKLSSTGNFIQAHALGGMYDEYAHDINVKSNGDVFICGSFSSPSIDADPGPNQFLLYNSNPGVPEGFVCRWSSGGQLVWAFSIGNLGVDECLGINFDNAGNILVNGWYDWIVDMDPGPGVFNLSSLGSQDGFHLLLKNDGSFLNALTHGSSDYCDEIYCGVSNDYNQIATNGNGVVYCTSVSGGTNIVIMNGTPQQVQFASYGGMDIVNFKYSYNLLTGTPDNNQNIFDSPIAFPSVFENKISINSTFIGPESKWILYNSEGKIMLCGNSFNTQEINTEEIPHGIYLLYVEKGDKKFKQKLVKH